MTLLGRAVMVQHQGQWHAACPALGPVNSSVDDSLVLDITRNSIHCRDYIHCALRGAPKSSLTACHRLGYDTPLLVSKSTFHSIDRPLGVGIRSQGFCSWNKWKDMLGMFSARQLAQGYNFVLNSFMNEKFLCLPGHRLWTQGPFSNRSPDLTFPE